MSMSMEFDGLDELLDALNASAASYPDVAENKLNMVSLKFKSRVIKITKNAVDTESGGRLITGYKLSAIRGYGINMQRDFSGRAPHFHLIENGHELVIPKYRKGKPLKNGGQNIGFVPGYMIVAQARKEFELKMPGYMREVVDEVFRKGGMD